ncbi:MAG: hypothetical protein IKX22_06295 [Prevotella sp.]|nr:hypothetical protein [Prevotella sp.]
MKKIYIAPTTEKIETELVSMLCRASQYTLNRYGQWGASTDQSEYGNNAWQIEGFAENAEAIGNFEAVEMGGDDYDDLASRANEALW